MKNWLAMCSAPRDGTRIIVLYADLSGVDLIRWGAPRKGGEACWFHSDWSDDALDDDAYAGWIPVPQNTPDKHFEDTETVGHD